MASINSSIFSLRLCLVSVVISLLHVLYASCRERSAGNCSLLLANTCGQYETNNFPGWDYDCIQSSQRCLGRHYHSTGSSIGSNRFSNAPCAKNIKYFPSFVLLIKTEKLQNICGGVLISNKFVLTAGHCVKDLKPDQVAVSPLISFKPDYGIHRMQLRYVKNFAWTYSQHDVAGRDEWADLAVLELDKPSEYAQPVCLPDKDNWMQGGTFNYLLTLGKTVDQQGNIYRPDVARLITVDKIKCRVLGSSGKWYETPEKTATCFLASANPQTGKTGSACQGDSGSPIYTIDEQGRQTVIGLVAFSFQNPGCLTATAGASLDRNVVWSADVFKLKDVIKELLARLGHHGDL